MIAIILLDYSLQDDDSWSTLHFVSLALTKTDIVEAGELRDAQMVQCWNYSMQIITVR